MIIPGIPEEKVLEELLCDKQMIEKETKKVAKKNILRLQKSGRDGIDDDLCYSIKTTTENNNHWLTLLVINMSNSPKWYHRSVCQVESEHGSKDFYIVRGFSNGRPYYIKFSSHTLKRFKERNINVLLNKEIDYDTEWLPTMIIKRGEIIPWMKITDPRLLKAALNAEDRYEINTLFYTFQGCYLGYETPKGNVEFKTFLDHHHELKKPEENIALYMCELAHAGFNKKMYSKKYLDSLFTDEYTFPDEIGEVMMKYKDNYKLLP